MKTNLKILLLSIVLLFSSIKIVLAESLQDLANELNEIRTEIANLTPAPASYNPILPVVGKFGKVKT